MRKSSRRRFHSGWVRMASAESGSTTPRISASTCALVSPATLRKMNPSVSASAANSASKPKASALALSFCMPRASLSANEIGAWPSTSAISASSLPVSTAAI